MALDPELNKILKEMWRIDEKISSGANLDNTEKEFYNSNLETISVYYSANNDYWQNKRAIDN